MHKKYTHCHIDITYRNYFTECQIAVTVTFRVNNYRGLVNIND